MARHPIEYIELEIKVIELHNQGLHPDFIVSIVNNKIKEAKEKDLFYTFTPIKKYLVLQMIRAYKKNAN